MIIDGIVVSIQQTINKSSNVFVCNYKTNRVCTSALIHVFGLYNQQKRNVQVLIKVVKTVIVRVYRMQRMLYIYIYWSRNESFETAMQRIKEEYKIQSSVSSNANESHTAEESVEALSSIEHTNILIMPLILLLMKIYDQIKIIIENEKDIHFKIVQRRFHFI